MKKDERRDFRDERRKAAEPRKERKRSVKDRADRLTRGIGGGKIFAKRENGGDRIMEETPVLPANASECSSADDPRVPFEDLLFELRY